MIIIIIINMIILLHNCGLRKLFTNKNGIQRQVILCRIVLDSSFINFITPCDPSCVWTTEMCFYFISSWRRYRVLVSTANYYVFFETILRRHSNAHLCLSLRRTSSAGIPTPPSTFHDLLLLQYYLSIYNYY